MNKRFVIREKLINPDDIIIKDETARTEDDTFSSWVKSSPVPRQSPTPKGSKPVKVKNSVVKSSVKRSKNIEMPAIQCNGITKKTGLPCKNMTKNVNGYCHHH